MAESLVVLITGSASGFGRMTAETIARKGHRVFATMRDPQGRNVRAAADLRVVAESEALDLRVIDLDVTSGESVREGVEETLRAAGWIDAVVNNAGQMCLGVTETFTEEQFQRQLEINLVGPFRVARAVLPHMRQRRSGLLVQISSIAGRVAHPFSGLYNASKWGLEALSEALRYELSAHGIDVVVVEPGPFYTGLVANGPTPLDMDRASAYRHLDGVRAEIQGRFARMLSDPAAPTDPQLVADAILDLIETPAGERPLRTVVGLDFDAVRDLNAATEPYRMRALEFLGVERLADLKSVSAAAAPEPRILRGSDAR